MKDRVLFIGWSGYLGQHILDSKHIKNYDITLFEGRVQNIEDFEKYYHHSFDQIWHFGSTNNKEQYTEYIIPGTHNAISFANAQKAKLVYASTMGILSADKNSYELAKKTSTVMINNSIALTKRLVLIIPRIYSKDRNSGLVKAIKDNKSLINNNLQYLTINSFVKQFYISLTKNGCYYFKNLKKDTVYNIKKWILS